MSRHFLCWNLFQSTREMNFFERLLKMAANKGGEYAKIAAFNFLDCVELQLFIGFKKVIRKYVLYIFLFWFVWVVSEVQEDIFLSVKRWQFSGMGGVLVSIDCLYEYGLQVVCCKVSSPVTDKKCIFVKFYNLIHMLLTTRHHRIIFYILVPLCHKLSNSLSLINIEMILS